jgi:hypothetical protein
LHVPLPALQKGDVPEMREFLKLFPQAYHVRSQRIFLPKCSAQNEYRNLAAAERQEPVTFKFRKRQNDAIELPLQDALEVCQVPSIS